MWYNNNAEGENKPEAQGLGQNTQSSQVERVRPIVERPPHRKELCFAVYKCEPAVTIPDDREGRIPRARERQRVEG